MLNKRLDMLEMQYTKEDYQRELNEFLKQLNAKAEKHGVFKSKDEDEREKKEKADRLEKTTDTYISYISRHDKAREMIEQLKANGYDLKFSTEMNSQYTDDAIIVNVSSENPDDLPQDEVSDIVQIMDKFMAYHTNYNQLKEIYDGHFLADNRYFESMFEYVAVKECCRNSSTYIQLQNVKKLMLMSGVYMYQIGLHCSEGRIKRALRKFRNCFNRTKADYEMESEVISNARVH